jgi:hypothetical protein
MNVCTYKVPSMYTRKFSPIALAEMRGEGEATNYVS